MNPCPSRWRYVMGLDLCSEPMTVRQREAEGWTRITVLHFNHVLHPFILS